MEFARGVPIDVERPMARLSIGASPRRSDRVPLLDARGSPPGVNDGVTPRVTRRQLCQTDHSCQLVSDRHSRFVVPASALSAQVRKASGVWSPWINNVRRYRSPCLLMAPSTRPAGMFLRGEPEVAGEVAAGGEPAHLADARDQRRASPRPGTPPAGAAWRAAELPFEGRSGPPGTRRPGSAERSWCTGASLRGARGHADVVRPSRIVAKLA